MEAEPLEIAVLIGLQGAGKSSFARRHLPFHALISKDRIQSVRDKAARQLRDATKALEAGQSIVIDNTSPRREDRAMWISLGRAFGAEVVGYFFDADPAVCLGRNAARVGKEKVPPVAVFTTRKLLEPPAVSEGFDALYRVVPLEDGFDVLPWDERVFPWAGPRRSAEVEPAH